MTRAPHLFLGVSIVLTACYAPSPKDGAFRCAPENNFACPEGLRCDTTTKLCISELGTPDMTLSGDGGIPIPPTLAPTCDERVRNGAFANARLLANANSAADDFSLALASTSDRIYFVSTRNGPAQLFTAAIDPASPAVASTVEAVTVSDPTLVPSGGSFASDGAYWFAGTATGTTQLYRATASPASMLTISQTKLPSTTGCAFSDPFYADGDASSELYVAFPLGGCVQLSSIAVGKQGRQMGAFYGAIVAQPGFDSPTLLAGSLTLLASSTPMTRRLHFAVRSSIDVQFSSPVPIPRGAWSSDATSDRQLIVRADCNVAYLVSARAGGTGGHDLWVLDVLP